MRVSFLEFVMLIVSMYSEHVNRSRFARRTVASAFGIRCKEVALFMTCLHTCLSSALSDVDSFILKIRFLLVSISSRSVEFPLQE